MKKATLFYFLYLPVLCLLCGSCVSSAESSRANAVAAPTAKLSTIRTYAWFQEQPVASVAYDEGYNGKLNEYLRQAIAEELQKKGFVKTTTGNPDVLVAYDVSVSVPLEKDNPQNFSDGFGYSYGYMSGYRYNYLHAALPGYRAVDLYKSGTLIIDLVNPSTNEVIWRGCSEGAISNFKASYNPVHNEVEKVLAPLPASPAH